MVHQQDDNVDDDDSEEVNKLSARVSAEVQQKCVGVKKANPRDGIRKQGNRLSVMN